ncbi:MAG: 3-hydroxyacyl-ACP dehydratase FabZ family protein [Planctomycetota bacterium]
MPPTLFIDPLTVDTENPARDIEDIRAHNRQRHEFEMLSGIALLDMENELVVGYKHVRDDEFWVRGHVPGRPLFPGALQIEASAQLTSYYYMESIGNPPGVFIGFMGVDGVKFRGFVEPGDTFIVAARPVEIRSRRCKFACQGYVRDKLVYEGTVLGAPM